MLHVIQEVNITQSWDDGQYTVFVEIKPVISEKGAEKKTKFSRQGNMNV